MKTFAFIVQPTNTSQLKNFWPIARITPNFCRKLFLKKRISKIKRVRSIQGKEIYGYLIALPFLPQQISEPDESSLLRRIIAAGHLAENLGAKILGLGYDSQLFADKDYIITKNLKIPITNGSTFTAWSVFEAIYRVAKTKNIELKKSTLAIIDATTAIGNLCARKLSSYVSRIVISAAGRDKLERLKETLLNLNPIEVIIAENPHQAAKDAEIVIITSGMSEMPLDIKELQPPLIIVKANSESNIAVIQAGLIKLPYSIDLGLGLGLPKDVVPACLAETMLLTLEERCVNYSEGENINADKMEEIADIAIQHGFEVWVPEAPVR